MSKKIQLDWDFDKAVFKQKVPHIKDDYFWYTAQFMGLKITYEKQYYRNETEIAIYKRDMLIKFIRFGDTDNPKGGTDHTHFFPAVLKQLGFKMIPKDDKNLWIAKLAGCVVKCNKRLWMRND